MLLLIALIGWGKRISISGFQQAANRFKQDFPMLDAVSGIVSNDRNTALLELRDGDTTHLGLVTVFGDKFVTRLLAPERTDLFRSSRGLTLKTSEVGFKTLNILLDRADSDHWMSLFSRTFLHKEG